MRFPWHKRIEEAREGKERARQEFLETKAKRPEVDKLVTEVRREVQANGWTTTIANIVGGFR